MRNLYTRYLLKPVMLLLITCTVNTCPAGIDGIDSINSINKNIRNIFTTIMSLFTACRPNISPENIANITIIDSIDNLKTKKSAIQDWYACSYATLTLTPNAQFDLILAERINRKAHNIPYFLPPYLSDGQFSPDLIAEKKNISPLTQACVRQSLSQALLHISKTQEYLDTLDMHTPEKDFILQISLIEAKQILRQRITY